MGEKEDFLSRWSRRKREAAAVPAAEDKAPASAAAPVASITPATPAAPEPLPPIESLTPESDFHPFMKPDVDEGLKREALKKLFQDPHYNTMDMLDVYVDDYSKPDPLPEGWLARLRQMDRLGHYQEPVEADAETPDKQPVPAEKIAMESPVGDVTSPQNADTDSAVSDVPEMGESVPRRPTPT